MQPKFSAKMSLAYTSSDRHCINQRCIFPEHAHLDWLCLTLKDCTWVSLILCTIRDSVNGNDITIFCCHFILLTGVSFVSNELILEEKGQMRLFAEVHFIYYMYKFHNEEVLGSRYNRGFSQHILSM